MSRRQDYDRTSRQRPDTGDPPTDHGHGDHLHAAHADVGLADRPMHRKARRSLGGRARPHRNGRTAAAERLNTMEADETGDFARIIMPSGEDHTEPPPNSWVRPATRVPTTISRPKTDRSRFDGAARGPVISARLQFRRQRCPKIAFAGMRPGVTAFQMGNMPKNRGEKP